MHEEKSFRLYWLDGKTEVIKGPNIETAFTRRGYGAGAVKAIDFYDNGEQQKYQWDQDLHDWVAQKGNPTKSYSKIANLS